MGLPAVESFAVTVSKIHSLTPLPNPIVFISLLVFILGYSPINILRENLLLSFFFPWHQTYDSNQAKTMCLGFKLCDINKNFKWLYYMTE